MGEVGKHQKPLSEMELELANLRRELARVKMERVILKKSGGNSPTKALIRCAPVFHAGLY